MLVHPGVVFAVFRVLAQQVRFLGPRAPVIDRADAAEAERVADRIDPRAVGHQEGQGRQPPEAVLCKIRRVTAEPIRAAGQHAAIGEVREADAERHGGPGVDAGEHHQEARPDPQQHGVVFQPVGPVGGVEGVADHPVVRHDPEHERGIAHQRGEPAGEERIAAADLRIERAESQQIADGADLHVDQEQQVDQRAPDRHWIVREGREVRIDDFLEPARQDRNHERGEEPFDAPRAPVLFDLADVPRFAPDQHRAEVPGIIARLHQHPVEPQHVRHREHEQRDRRGADHLHREQVLVAPVPAADAVKEADDDPGGPQPRELGHRHVNHLGQRARMVPVDSGGGAAMDFLDQHRPERHRTAREQQCGERGVRPVERHVRRRQPEHVDQQRPVAADHQPDEQAGQADQADPRRNVAAGQPYDRGTCAHGPAA